MQALADEPQQRPICDPSLEHLDERGAIHAVEEGHNVGLQNPAHFAPTDDPVQGAHGVMGTAPRAETVGAVQEVLLVDRFQYLAQGVLHELPTENEEWANRWRTARLQDLGFPPWDEAMALYRHLPPAERGRIDSRAAPLDVAEWHLPVWIPSLPAGRESRHRIFQSIADLEPEERRAAFYAFVAVANKIAVADRMDLSDAETINGAIEKAAIWMSRGLDLVTEENALAPVEVLRSVALERLFTVGANLDPKAAGPPLPE